MHNKEQIVITRVGDDQYKVVEMGRTGVVSDNIIDGELLNRYLFDCIDELEIINAK